MRVVFLNIDLAPYHNWVFRELILMGYKVTVYYFDKKFKEPKFLKDKVIFIYKAKPKIFLFKKSDIVVTAGYSVINYFITAFIHKKISKGITKFTCDTISKRSFSHKLYNNIGRFIFPNTYDYCLAAGEKQMSFAGKLGFKTNQILNGCYSANEVKFDTGLRKNKNTILFVGRLEKVKGLEQFITWFLDYKNMNKFVFNIIGFGELEDYVSNISNIYNNINFLGKLDNSSVQKEMEKSSIFVLPSVFEPWGVVLHEAAAYGCFLIANQNVVSASTFIKTSNGGIFKNYDELTAIFNKYLDFSETELNIISKVSVKLSKKITPILIAKNIIK